MTGRVALDTNILIYAVSSGNDHRRSAAADLARRSFAANAVVPLQVLGEFLNVCRRKGVATPEAAIERVVEWLPLFTTPPTEAHHLIEAAGLSNRYGLAFFDALICAVAIRAGATHLLSEDMQDGMRVDELMILNPFAERNSGLIVALFGNRI